MTEKSGINMLEEILDRIKVIEKRLSIMDNNIKSIANSANLANLIDKAAGTSLDTWAKATKPGLPKKTKDSTGFKNFSFESVDAAKMAHDAPLADKKSRGNTKNIMVKGKLKINNGDKMVPLSGASVKIYNNKDEVVKQTKTNKAGHWFSQLVPGKYVVLFTGEINGKQLLPQNKNFEVPETLPKGQTEFEVI